MHILIGVIVAVLVVAAVITLVVLHYMGRFLAIVRRLFSGEYTDEEVERYSQKRYRGDNGNRFSDDYFRSAASQADEAYAGQHTTRTVHQDGVSIIDERHGERPSRKIFSDDEGEYVEYSEVKE